jgi:hypothetical protein
MTVMTDIWMKQTDMHSGTKENLSPDDAAKVFEVLSSVEDSKDETVKLSNGYSAPDLLAAVVPDLPKAKKKKAKKKAVVPDNTKSDSEDTDGLINMYSGGVSSKDLIDFFKKLAEPSDTKKKLNLAVGSGYRKLLGKYEMARTAFAINIQGLILNFSKAEREAIMFYIEKTPVPVELNRPDLQEILDKAKKDPVYGQRISELARYSKLHMDANLALLKKNFSHLSIEQIDNYVSHLWGKRDFTKEEKIAEFRKILTDSPQLHQRFIKTYHDGIARGFTPRYLDIANILQNTSSVALQASTNNAFIKLLEGNNDAGNAYIIPARTDEERQAAEFAGYEPTGIKELSEYMIHPDAKPLINTMFQTKFKGKGVVGGAIQGYEFASSLLKNVILSWGMFQHMTIAVTGLGSMKPSTAAKITLDFKTMYDFAKGEGYKHMLERWPLAADYIEHGGSIPPPTEASGDAISASLSLLEEGLSKINPTLGGVAEMLKDGQNAYTAILWGYFNNSFKLASYDYALTNMKKKLPANASPELIKTMKEEIVQRIANDYGGQNFKAQMVSPRTLQVAQAMLLSPDFTISAIKQVLGVTGIGSITQTKEGRAALRESSGRFWLRAGIIYMLASNSVNIFFRHEDEENEYFKKLRMLEADKVKLEGSIAEKEMDENGLDIATKSILESQRKSLITLNEKISDVKRREPSLFNLSNIMNYSMLGNSTGRKFDTFVGRNSDGTERYRPLYGQLMDGVDWMFMVKDGIPNNYVEPSESVTKKLGNKANPMLQMVSLAVQDKSLSGLPVQSLVKARDKGAFVYSSTLLVEILKASRPIAVQTFSGEYGKENTFTDLAFPQVVGSSGYKLTEAYTRIIVENLQDRIKVDKTVASIMDRKSGLSNAEREAKTEQLTNSLMAPITAKFTKNLEEIDKTGSNNRLNTLAVSQASLSNPYLLRTLFSLFFSACVLF